jgi:hypothetical protein
MIGLGNLGLGKRQAAQQYLDAVLARDASHLGAALHRKMV